MNKHLELFGPGRNGEVEFDLTAPMLNLTMQESPPTGVNASHFGVQVASTADVLEAKARFEREGLAIKTEEDVTCCYAVQDKVWGSDPDGNSWEVFFVQADAGQMKPAKDREGCCAGGACG